MWDFHDPAGSAERFRDALERAAGPGRLVLQTQLARAEGLQERYDDGHRILDEVAAADSSHPEVAVRLALERGRLLRSSGDPQAAVPLFDAAVAVARAAGLEVLMVDALHMVALVAPADRQLQLTRDALAAARSATNPAARAWEASLLNNIGMCQVDAGDPEGALETFRAALAAWERLEKPVGDVRIARWMVGWALRLVGRTAEALAVQEALAAELAADGEEDPYVEEELALLRR